MKMPVFLACLALNVARCASVPAQSVVVPFDLVKRQIVLQVRVNGQGPYAMLLDTLVDPSVIDLRTASKAGAEVDQSHAGEAEGVGSGRTVIHAAKIPALTIGGVDFGSIPAIASDMTSLSLRLGRPLDGVLGYSFLRGKVVTIDYSARTVSINAAAPHTVVDRGDSAEVPFTIDADNLVIVKKGFFFNGVAIRASVDTGSSLVADLYRPAIDKLNLSAHGELTTITGARGEARLQRVKVNSITIGPLVQKDVDVALSTRADFGPNRDANIGNGFLENYVVTIDYRRRRITLRPGPVIASAPSAGSARRELPPQGW